MLRFNCVKIEKCVENSKGTLYRKEKKIKRFAAPHLSYFMYSSAHFYETAVFAECDQGRVTGSAKGLIHAFLTIWISKKGTDILAKK